MSIQPKDPRSSFERAKHDRDSRVLANMGNGLDARTGEIQIGHAIRCHDSEGVVALRRQVHVAAWVIGCRGNKEHGLGADPVDVLLAQFVVILSHAVTLMDNACSYIEPMTSSSDWANDSAARWLSGVDSLEAQLAPLTELLFEECELRQAMNVLDVGCGAGSTTRRAGELVGPDGTATGLDIAPAMIEAAADRSSHLLNIHWRIDDAQTARFERAFDAVISRFGVMFFDDLTAAFANLRSAMTPGASLTCIVWQRGGTSPILDLPAAITRQTLARIGITVEPEGEYDGKSSLGSSERALAVLRDAGWLQPTWDPREIDLYLGGPGTIDEAVACAMNLGPTRRALDQVSQEALPQVTAALYDALSCFHDGSGVKLCARVAVIQATAP